MIEVSSLLSLMAHTRKADLGTAGRPTIALDAVVRGLCRIPNVKTPVYRLTDPRAN